MVYCPYGSATTCSVRYTIAAFLVVLSMQGCWVQGSGALQVFCFCHMLRWEGDRFIFPFADVSELRGLLGLIRCCEGFLLTTLRHAVCEERRHLG